MNNYKLYLALINKYQNQHRDIRFLSSQEKYQNITALNKKIFVDFAVAVCWDLVHYQQFSLFIYYHYQKLEL